jgi:hypothetical protein
MLFFNQDLTKKYLSTDKYTYQNKPTVFRKWELWELDSANYWHKTKTLSLKDNYSQKTIINKFK